jgi:hypothetical protein
MIQAALEPPSDVGRGNVVAAQLDSFLDTGNRLRRTGKPPVLPLQQLNDCPPNVEKAKVSDGKKGSEQPGILAVNQLLKHFW